MSRISDEIFESAKDIYDIGLMSEAELRQFSGYTVHDSHSKRTVKTKSDTQKTRQQQFKPLTTIINAT